MGYDFGHSDLEQIKDEIAKKLQLKDGEITFDGKKIKITMKGEPGKTPKKGEDYKDGEDGVSPPGPEHQWDGTKLRVQNPDGTWGQWCDLQGEKGEGEPGKTPKKGVDYKDGEDGDPGDPGVEPEEMTAIRTELKLTGEWVKQTMEKLARMNERLDNVKDGKTPEKGVDYKDGDPGGPGVEPEEMKIIRIDLGLMKDSIKGMGERIAKMDERLANVKDGDPGENAILPASVTIKVVTDIQVIDGNLQTKYQDVKIYLGD